MRYSKKIKIKSIIINDEEIAVEQKIDNEDGIKFYINDQNIKFFDQKGASETISLETIKIRIDNNKIYSLFECFYTIRGDIINHEYHKELENLYVHLKYNILVMEDVNEKDFLCDKLEVDLEYIENLSKNNFFKNASFNLDYISIDYLSTKTKQKIIVSSNQDSSTKELFFCFMRYFELINLIIGYFPNIRKKVYKYNKKEYIVEEDIASAYISADKYKKNDLYFFKEINNELFKQAYIKYRAFYEKTLLPLSMYLITMMKKPSYVDIDMVNILQALDGLYDNLTIFECKKEEYPKEMHEEIEELISSLDFSTIKNKYESKVDINKRINCCIKRMHLISYRKKLKNMFEYDNYLVFKEEKKKNNSPYIYYDTLIDKCYNSRNRLSHFSEQTNYLSATENVTYVYKIVLIFRLLLLEEIGLKSQIDKSKLEQHINLVNDYIKNIK